MVSTSSHFTQCLRGISHLDIDIGEDDLIYIVKTGLEDRDVWRAPLAEETRRSTRRSKNDSAIVAYELAWKSVL